MRLVYAVEKVAFESDNHIGVRKKVYSMMRYFERNGINSKLCEYEWRRGFPTMEVTADTDILYFRHLVPTVKIVLKLFGLKKSKPIKIIMEVPTYPFEGEQVPNRSIKKRISEFAGKKMFRFVVDKIVIIGSGEKIKKLYGVSVIHANNGVCFEEVPISKCLEKDNQLDLIAVSSCFFWHGYDRLIRGMHEYYSGIYDIKVNFHIVGDGECLAEYEELAEEKGLLDTHVFTYGNLEGEKLDKLYDKADIAIDCLACHRKKVSYVSALKVREYAAKGLPIITATRMDIYNDNTKKYIMELASDESNIDIRSILEFYSRFKEKGNILNQRIRETFRPYCEWENTFDRVVQYMKSAN